MIAVVFGIGDPWTARTAVMPVRGMRFLRCTHTHIHTDRHQHHCNRHACAFVSTTQSRLASLHDGGEQTCCTLPEIGDKPALLVKDSLVFVPLSAPVRRPPLVLLDNPVQYPRCHKILPLIRGDMLLRAQPVLI
jgi:hypothetical protein